MMNISEKLVKAMQTQFVQEIQNSLLYQNMASWLFLKGYDGHAEYLKRQFLEEYEHSLKFYDYLTDRGYAPSVVFEDVSTQFLKSYGWNDPIEIMRESLAAEISTSEKIMELYEIAEEEKDFASKTFLKYFLEEQVNEENQFANILREYELLKDSNEKYFIMDQMLETRINEEADEPEKGDI